MGLKSSPFPNCFVEIIHAVGWAFILPCFWCLDRVIALCKSTTFEQAHREVEECHLHPLKVFFGFTFFFILFVATAPLAFLGFLLWAPLQACRRPFCYHKEVPSSPEAEKRRSSEVAGKISFGFASANLCLLPDGLARFNNLGHTQRRATAIGQHILQGVTRPHIRIYVDSPSSCDTVSPPKDIAPTSSPTSTEKQVDNLLHCQANERHVCKFPSPHDDHESTHCETPSPPPPTPPPPPLNSNQNSNHQGSSHTSTLLSQGPCKQNDVAWEISSLFPANIDILCLEEVFDKRAAKKLINILKPEFGHILYDVGVYGCQPPCRCSSFKFINSGLFLASRFPVLKAKYHWFPNSSGEDALAAKGLLSVKVLIGKNQKKRKVVGFFNCTHLHAPEGDGEIRYEQLNMVTRWIRDFQTFNKKSNEDVIFDVLCGDFNFDNCSPDDYLEQNHSLFDEYSDPCRAGPGREKPWVVGTLLKQPTLYDNDVNTPESLQRTLESAHKRKLYICPPVPLHGFPLVYPMVGHPWVGRRIDYILYRQSSISPQCQTEVEEFTFITQLAGLTDHVPVSMRLNVTMDE